MLYSHLPPGATSPAGPPTPTAPPADASGG